MPLSDLEILAIRGGDMLVKVKELTAGMGGVDIQLEIVEVLGPRTISTPRRDFTVVQAVGKDETGQVAVTMRSDQAANVKVKSRIRIQGGTTREREGQLMVSAGRYGTLTVTG